MSRKQSKVKNTITIADDHRKLVQAEKKKFSKWKSSLCKMIHNESGLARRKEDQSFVYLLPDKLVRLVMQVSIAEKVRAETVERGEKGAIERAMVSILLDLGYVSTAQKEDKIDHKIAETEERSDLGNGEGLKSDVGEG